MEQPKEEIQTPSSTTSKRIWLLPIKILLLLGFILFFLPGFLLGWSMVVQSLLEMKGYAEPTYSRYAVCVAVDNTSLYQKALSPSDVEYYGRILIQDCEQIDKDIDGGDGPSEGKVRWYLCYGIDCHEGWEYSFTKQRGSSHPATTGAVVIFALLILVPLGFAVQAVRGIFSSEIRKKVRAKPFLHIGWFLLSLAIIFPFLALSF
jgi:TRAP-type mannitol/chloroaromatic compound transport system permease small subunit